MPRILVIKLGALGDFVLATGAFRAIRAHHSGDHITLLTTARFADFARGSGDFDDVWVDSRAKPWQVGTWFRLARRLRAGDFRRVYDLQRSDRTHAYFRLIFGLRPPQWSGVARGCSHPYAPSPREHVHIVEREAAQLAIAGIHQVPPPDLSWVEAEFDRFAVDGRFALLAPGGAAHRLEKRWPARGYAAVAAALARRGVRPVLIGGPAERQVLAGIATACPEARDLCGVTSLAEIVALARGACGAVGNDTGPMHLIATAGCPSLVLFSSASNPELIAPRGPDVTVLRRAVLAELSADEVIAALNLR